MYGYTVTIDSRSNPTGGSDFDPGSDNLGDASMWIQEAYGTDFIIKASEEWEGLDLTSPEITLKRVWRLAELANDQNSPAAFMAWLAKGYGALADLENIINPFEQEFQGEFKDLAEFAQDKATDDDEFPSWLFPHVNWEAAGRNLAMDYTVVKLDTGKTAIFKP